MPQKDNARSGALRGGGARMVLLALAAGLSVEAGAQGAAPANGAPAARVNTANWTLANRFAPAALRPIIYGGAVQPRWIGKTDSLWYNWRDDDGTHFYLVVPGSTSKRPLFDRQKLAAQLAELARRPIDANNLPFTNLTFLKSHRGFRFNVDTTRYEWTLATQTLRSLGRVQRGGTPPADEEREERRGNQGGGSAFPTGGNRNEFRNFSPDSTAFAFARDHNLYVVDVARSDTVQVTTSGALDHSFGFRDTTVSRRQLDSLGGGGQQENQDEQNEDQNANAREMRVRPNVSWSPDSKAFAIVRQDQRKVGDLWLVNVLSNPRPTLLRYKYAMPGEENVPQSELWVYTRGTPSARQLDVRRFRDQRLMNVHWPVNGQAVRLVRRDRPQRNLEFVEIDAATSAVKVLLTESVESNALDPQPVRYVRRGGDFIWWSERSGWGHFYTYGFNGGPVKRALTSGAWHADAIADVDSTRGIVWLTGNGREKGENPYYQHLYRVNGDGSGFTLVDPGNFTHAPTLSPTMRYVVDSYSRVDAPTKSVLRDANTGRVVMNLEEMNVSKLRAMGWRPPEMFVVKAADGVTDIYGNMWKPFDFDSTRKYPIVANVYPGPQTESVTVPFTPSNVNQQMAQLGMIVIQIGNRGGSPKRSAAYHRYGYYNLRDYALADDKTGIEQLAALRPYIDLDRVGIYGHSGGGFLTAAAMMLPPYNDFFKVGWSESGNHDNNIYNQNWSEWNHGLRIVTPGDSARRGGAAAQRTRATASAGRTPPTTATGDSNVVGVRADTLVNQDSIRFQIRVPTNQELAANLKGRLMLMTGDLDNNVHPGGTTRLAEALVKANKRFDYMIVPGQPHGYRTMVTYTNKLMLEYFAEHLLGDYYRASADMK